MVTVLDTRDTQSMATKTAIIYSLEICLHTGFLLLIHMNRKPVYQVLETYLYFYSIRLSNQSTSVQRRNLFSNNMAM